MAACPDRIPFEADSFTLRRRAAPPIEYVPEGALPLTLALWLHWEAHGAHGDIFVRWIALAWLFLLGGVLRFAHVQRSSEFQFFN